MKGATIIHYRDYSKYDSSIFRSGLREELIKCYRDRTTFNHCNFKVEGVLNKHVPLEKNLLEQMMVHL